MKQTFKIVLPFLLLLMVNNLKPFFSNGNIHWFQMPSAGTTVHWFLYDLGNVLSFVIFFFSAYLYVDYSKILLKTLLLATLLLYIKEVFDLVWFNNQGSDYTYAVETAFTLILILTCMYKSNAWHLKNIKSDLLYKDGVYLLVSYPHNFYAFVGTWLGNGAGSIKILTKTENDIRIFRIKREGKQKHVLSYLDYTLENIYNYLNKNERIIFLKDIQCVTSFKEDLMNITGTKWSPIKNNCSSVFSEIFKKHGVKGYSFIPSLFIKRLTYDNSINPTAN